MVDEVSEKRGKLTKKQILEQIQSKSNEARKKELTAKVEALVKELNDAKAVVKAKEQKLEDLFEDYEDVIG